MDGSLPCELFLSHMGSCLPADIFFLIGKHTEIYIYIYMKRRKGCLKANPKHTGSMQEAPKSMNKKEEGGQKIHTSPHPLPIKKID